MEVVLTRLKDFSSKEATFDDYKAAVMFRNQPLAEEECREERLKCDHAGRLNIENALAWLRRELILKKSFMWDKEGEDEESSFLFVVCLIFYVGLVGVYAVIKSDK